VSQNLIKILWDPHCWLCEQSPSWEKDLCWSCLRAIHAATNSNEGLLTFQPATAKLVRKSRLAAPHRSANLFWRIAMGSGCIARWRRQNFSAIYWLPQGAGEISGLEIFAQRVGEALGIGVFQEFRKISESPQHRKNRRDRLDSEILFEFTGARPPERVLLLDDVQTSGTSLLQGKYLLRKAGAKFVQPFPLVMNMMDSFEGKSSEPQEEGEEMNPFALQLFV
jgi:predicted amidophosphoribosyltransferase